MSRNIRTLGNLQKDDRDSGEESDGGGERQGFFVGGSEHSGQQVLGPQRPKRNNDIVEKIFTAARQHGAEMLNSQDLVSRSRHEQHGTSSGGVRLGANFSGPLEPGEADHEDNDTGEPEEVVVELIVWENGFSIDDGPLRSFEEPESRQFLESIMEGRVPAELLVAHPRRRIDLRMQRRSGPYEAPKLKPFQGAGARLGAIVPQVVTSTSVPSSSNSTQDPVENMKKAQSEVSLDSNSPVTQVQIRLPNGQRVCGRFNHSHTVDAIRTFIVSAFPDMGASPFQLMTTFPNKVIDDETVNLKDAGIINAVVVVKLCV